MIYGRIYKITNTVNQKVYVGQTIQALEARFRDHCNLKKSTERSAIRFSIQKYGRGNFKIEEIDQAESQDELNKKEIYWIGRLNCLCPNGYNLSLGGNGGGKLHESTKRKISDNQKGRPSTAVWSVETRQRLSKMMTGMGNHRFGISDSEETRLRKSLSHKGKQTTWSCVPLRCIETGQEYPSWVEAAKQTGISSRHLCWLIKNKKRSRKYGMSFERIVAQEKE